MIAGVDRDPIPCLVGVNAAGLGTNAFRVGFRLLGGGWGDDRRAGESGPRRLKIREYFPRWLTKTKYTQNQF